MKWFTIEDEMPNDDIRCLVVMKNQNYADVLTWNAHYKVWDDMSGDDYYCDKDNVDLWIPFTDLPIIPIRKK